jgi:hypothetical protein
MLTEIEQFIAWVRMRSPLTRTIAGFAGRAKIQSVDLAEACFADFLS